MCFKELKEKALSLPYAPGVYIMKDAQDRVIYVGKAKKLKNRVSQYFQDTASHSPKTRQMVSKIHHFDFLVAASEFEALILECSLIKRHQPKYNILLKDGKGYPYIRLDKKSEFPKLTMVNRPEDDGAEYFGPFGSRGVTTHLLETIRVILRLPQCNKKFSTEQGRGRVCLHHHMNQCEGWCQMPGCRDAYRMKIEQARMLLLGHYKTVAMELRSQMLDAAEQMNFELAASLRDQLSAVENLGNKQLVSTDAFADTDVIGYARNDIKACFTVLHFRDGTLMDKEFEVFSVPDDDNAAVSTLMKQYYLSRGVAPKVVFLPFAVDDSQMFSQLLEQDTGRKCRFKVPQRGDNAKLVDLANTNASEELERVTDREERLGGTMQMLAQMLGVAGLHRMESYDISNISGADMVGAMVVFVDGAPRKSEYKKFKLRDMHGQDDYGAMTQVLCRRFEHYLSGDKGFNIMPDLLLIDGGVQHAAVAKIVLDSLGISVSIFGMVKDDRHRTRALVTPMGEEIRIDNKPSVFALIGSIQEETHRFAISYHRNLRSKRLRHSELDGIPGIGPKRKQDLLKNFKSISGIASATLEELARYLPADVAISVYEHFKDKEG